MENSTVGIEYLLAQVDMGSTLQCWAVGHLVEPNFEELFDLESMIVDTDELEMFVVEPSTDERRETVGVVVEVFQLTLNSWLDTYKDT